ncbi:MAG: DUF481 domain-containing protein [Deltaproteobacteria bacterium]|nr:DUF481 domain-containing protein [Deltaproteobacteria bacterium]
MRTPTRRIAFLAPVALAVMLVVLPAVARAQDETPPPAADTAAASASTDEAGKPAAAAEAATPAEPPTCPKCECPPCPEPPPPPPPPPADGVEWKAQSKGGMLVATGNAQSKSFTFGVNGSRKQGNNKVALEGAMTYGTTNVMIANVDSTTDPSKPTITSLDREEAVTSNNWAAKGRYDRFITENNTAFASGLAAADKVAGKTFFGGGQLGYSRQLLKDEWNLLVAELGYDFSYERYVQQPDKALDPVAIHSARVFVGETLSLSKETGITASVEALFNLNKEKKAINASDDSVGVKAFKDTRINGKLALTTNLWKSLGFGFSFAVKYDQNPAPRPVPKGAPAGTVFPTDTHYAWAYADKVDTVTEATLIYTFF